MLTSCQEATELLLSAVHHERGEDGLMASFLYGPPGSLSHDRRLGTTIYFRSNKMLHAALYVRRNGHRYLRFLPIETIKDMLSRFVIENYWHIAQEIPFYLRFDKPFAEVLSAKAKASIADELLRSNIFSPAEALTVFPLCTVSTQSDFESDLFFLISPNSLSHSLGPAADFAQIAPTQFPPIKEIGGQIEFPSSWLGIKSPSRLASEKIKTAILGALALAVNSTHRHIFSGRKTFGGYCNFSEGIEFSSGDAHTPPLLDDIVLTADDHWWLSSLAIKLQSPERETRRQIFALEYFYRSWPLGPSERYPILCMTLDAVLGSASQATQAIIEGVREVIGRSINSTRIRKLVELRASVIHGGAPDVYDSRKYEKYYNDFHADPIADLELLVTTALQRLIFGEKFVEHEDPNKEIISQLRAAGHLPVESSKKSILDDIE